MTDYICERCGMLASQHAVETVGPNSRVTITARDGACDRPASEVERRAYVPEPVPPPPPMPEPVE